MKHEDSTYEIVKVNKAFNLLSLASDFDKKNIFAKYKNTVSFSLFQHGEPEWENHKGGGRYIVKTKDWHCHYDLLFQWLRKLDQESEIMTSLSIIAGFRFKIIPVSKLYTMEVWFIKPKQGKYKLHKTLEFQLEKKLSSLFTDSCVKTDRFIDKKNKNNYRYKKKRSRFSKLK